jgi:hypothetical protein
VFFDQANKAYTIRIDPPFNGKLGGRDIVRTRTELIATAGTRFKPISVHAPNVASTLICDFDAATQARFDFDASGNLLTVFLLNGTLWIENPPGSP